MGVYFFDSSALVKRYAVETGTTWVSQVTDPKSGNKIYIAAITGAEVLSAIMKKVRDTKHPLPQGDADKAIAEFRNDFANQYELIRITDSLVQSAMGLVERHQLRGYDAVQLAAALIVNTQSRLQGSVSRLQGIAATGIPPLVVVASDYDLLKAALAENLATDDPRAHP